MTMTTSTMTMMATTGDSPLLQKKLKNKSDPLQKTNPTILLYDQPLDQVPFEKSDPHIYFLFLVGDPAETFPPGGTRIDGTEHMRFFFLRGVGRNKQV